MNRRAFLKLSGAGMLSLYLASRGGMLREVFAQPVPGGTQDPTLIPKYQMPLVKPPSIKRDKKIKIKGGKQSDYYEIAVKQFSQQILPPGYAPTTVWSYGPANAAPTLANGYFYPAFTLETKFDKPTVVKWVNGLVDGNGSHLQHLLPVDQTLHWANPPGPRDRRGTNPDPYLGPVPMVTHVHGAHTTEESDGYAEAWYLPDVATSYYKTGTFYDYFNAKYNQNWDPGTATFTYPNDQPATTLWYHDHTLGMTRLNVYAGPAGFYLVRGGPNDLDLGYVAPGPGIDPFGAFTEIPIAIQDRSFNADGSLFYPDNRAFFEGLDPAQLQIPFIPDPAVGGLSDISPIWNPEFFGNTMVVNGQTWPYLEVEQTRYRFRLLNGCNSRFLILKTDNGMPFTQIGAEQGFLPTPVQLNELLMAPAERADVIMDFSTLPVGTTVTLLNIGPDEPFGGGVPGVDFAPADIDTTGQVMEFRVIPATGMLPTTPGLLPVTLPAPVIPAAVNTTRDVSLNEEESKTVFVTEDADGNIVFDELGEPFGPQSALLGYIDIGGTNHALEWMAPISENPALNTTEEWTIHNFTADAHPIHVHQVKFEVVGRGNADGSIMRGPEVWETGPKDTVISYPGEITKIRMHFDLPGYYVWHCHIVEHEDNEMMRPFHVGPIPPDGPQQ